MKRTILTVLIVALLIADIALFGVIVGMVKPWDSMRPQGVTEEVMQENLPTPSELSNPSSATSLPTSVTDPTQVTEAPTDPPTEPTEALTSEEFLLTFLGDCTLGADPDIYYAQLGFVKTVGSDYGYPFRNVLTYLQEDDFTMANLEGVLSDSGLNPTPKAFNFRGPTDFVQILTQNSIEAVTIANNHTMDYGNRGYKDTKKVLDEAAVPYVEAQGTCLVTTERGLKIGVFAMTYSDLDQNAMLDGIAKLKEEGAELIVVALHWGTEGSYTPADSQRGLARKAIDAGAHIVYGTHPHVLQPIEEYNGGIIYYSLANFAFGGNAAPSDMDTVLLRQKVLRYSDGTVALAGYEAVPASVSSAPKHNNYQPTPYEVDSPEYQRVLAKLAGEDFEP